MKHLRIAVAGFRHETNTFSPVKTRFEDFEMTHGDAIVPRIEHGAHVEFVPTFVAYATPNGLVGETTYARIRGELLQALAATLPVDGIYLDLHGAMEVERWGDGETNLLHSIRQLTGPDVLIAVSLDLHGNISPDLVASANIFTAYRTAPHRDHEETRQRALGLLVRALEQDIRPVPVMIKVPMLLPGEAAMTPVEPARSLYARLPEMSQRPGIMDASLLIGCAWTDSPYTTTSVIVTAERDARLAHDVGAELARLAWARRREFGFSVPTASVDEAIKEAMRSEERPVFLSDAGDNITAGGAGDIPYFTERLIALGAQDALVAGLFDPDATRQCALAGVGGTVELVIGGKLDQINGTPLPLTAVVEHLAYDQEGDTEVSSALVRAGGVRVILTRERRPFTDRAAIAAAGIDPMAQQIVVVKLGYLFPDLYDHAPRAIMALSAGATDLRLTELPYERVIRPIFPLDPEMEWDVPDAEA
jgi:microcystin degradation protein MlrC